MPAPPPRARRPADRPEEILAAALEVFEEAGFDAARMEDVAARAGLSKAGVYLYFESKEALLRALIERHIAPIAARAATLAQLGQADPEEALRAIVSMAASQVMKPRIFAIPRLVIAIAPRFPDIATHYREQVLNPLWRALTGLIEAGARDGRFAPVDPGNAVRAIMGPLVMEALRRHALGDHDTTDWEVWPMTQLDFALRALRPDTPQ